MLKVRTKVKSIEAKSLAGVPALLAVGPSGVRYQLQHAFPSMEAAERLAQQVRAKGSVDPSPWTVVGTVPGAAADIAARALAASEHLLRERNPEARLAA